MNGSVMSTIYILMISAALSVSCGDEKKNSQNPVQTQTTSNTKGQTNQLTKNKTNNAIQKPIVTPVQPQNLIGQWMDGRCRKLGELHTRLLYLFNTTKFRIRTAFYYDSKCSSREYIEPEKLEGKLYELASEGVGSDYTIGGLTPSGKTYQFNYSENGQPRYGAIAIEQGKLYLGLGCTTQQGANCSQNLGMQESTRQNEVDKALPLTRL